MGSKKEKRQRPVSGVYRIIPPVRQEDFQCSGQQCSSIALTSLLYGTIKPIELWKPGGLDKVLQVEKEAAWPSGKGAGLEIRRSRVHRDVPGSPWFNSLAALVHSQLVSLPASWDPKPVKFVSKSGVHVNYLER